MRTRLILWLARGFGSGQLPGAPGTWGSLVGLVWFAVLLTSGSPLLYVCGTVALLGLAVPVCTWAERSLRQPDPGSVVLDEIAAVPLCFGGWVFVDWLCLGAWPDWGTFFTGYGLLGTAATFALFRLLDAWKPFPINRSQRLPAGWGIVADDLLAGTISGVLIGSIRWLWPGF